MSYTTPITDRTYSDIVNRTSKAFFNVTDWDRINDNTAYIHNVVSDSLGVSIPIASLSEPAYEFATLIEDGGGINTLLLNIEQVRLALVARGINIPSLSEIFHSWEAGITKDAPDYNDVNTWEQSIALIYQFFQYRERYPRCGLARCGSGMTRQNGFRR